MDPGRFQYAALDPLAGALGDVEPRHAGEQAETHRHQQQQDQRTAGEAQQRARYLADRLPSTPPCATGSAPRQCQRAQPFETGAAQAAAGQSRRA